MALPLSSSDKDTLSVYLDAIFQLHREHVIDPEQENGFSEDFLKNDVLEVMLKLAGDDPAYAAALRGAIIAAD